MWYKSWEFLFIPSERHREVICEHLEDNQEKWKKKMKKDMKLFLQCRFCCQEFQLRKKIQYMDLVTIKVLNTWPQGILLNI